MSRGVGLCVSRCRIELPRSELYDRSQLSGESRYQLAIECSFQADDELFCFFPSC